MSAKTNIVNSIGEDRLFEGRKIPKAVIKRLSLYARVLQRYQMDDIDKISSKELGEALGLNSAQVRKDLAYFGQFGVPGFGYRVEQLRTSIKTILGTDRPVRLGLAGVGNLGLALLAYTVNFGKQGFETVAAFDADKRKIGGERRGVPVYHIDDLAEKIRDLAIDIIVLAVPAENAQEIADTAVGAGISGILNFVPRRLVVPEGVKVQYIDMSVEIESLSFYLK